jgi:hypothetical protein
VYHFLGFLEAYKNVSQLCTILEIFYKALKNVSKDLYYSKGFLQGS